MIDFLFLVPIAVAMALVALAAFLWSLRYGQYDDLDGAAQRILIQDREGPAADSSDVGRSGFLRRD